MPQTIDKDDCDASCFPALRRPLVDGTEPLLAAMATTWDQGQIARWQRSLVPRDCPLCRTSHRQSDLIVAKNGVDVVRCRECSMVYTSSISESRLDLVTYTDPRTAAAFVRHHKADAYRMLARRKHDYYLQTAELFVRPGPLLDVGCCGGEFMVAARDRHWTPTGIDASEHFTALAKAQGFEARTGVVPDSLPLEPGERYRVISLLDVVEHLPDPVASLRRLASHLETDGLLLIQVPNYHSPLVALQGAANRNYSFGHCSHFTSATLAATAEAAGLRPLRLETVLSELDVILTFERELVERCIAAVVGDEPVPEPLDTGWLHEHLLGYKLFGLFSPTASR